MASVNGGSASSTNGHCPSATLSHDLPVEIPESEHIPRPIFVIGARRSGASLLALSIGQHSNIRHVPDAAWLERFSIGVQASIDEDAARGELSQLTALGINQAHLFEAFGAAIDRLILASNPQLEPPAASALVHEAEPTWQSFGHALDRLNARGHVYRPTRWIDSCYTHCFIVDVLHRLFPSAKFIHVVRDVRETVAALVDPSNSATYKSRHVAFALQDAWEHWLEATTACIEAERAFGPTTVRRIGWEELVTDPQAAIQRSLDFLGEPFDAACLRPLTPSPILSPNGRDVESLDEIPTDLRVQAETLSYALL